MTVGSVVGRDVGRAGRQLHRAGEGQGLPAGRGFIGEAAGREPAPGGVPEGTGMNSGVEGGLVEPDPGDEARHGRCERDAQLEGRGVPGVGSLRGAATLEQAARAVGSPRGREGPRERGHDVARQGRRAGDRRGVGDAGGERLGRRERDGPGRGDIGDRAGHAVARVVTHAHLSRPRQDLRAQRRGHVRPGVDVRRGGRRRGRADRRGLVGRHEDDVHPVVRGPRVEGCRRAVGIDTAAREGMQGRVVDRGREAARGGGVAPVGSPVGSDVGRACGDVDRAAEVRRLPSGGGLVGEHHCGHAGAAVRRPERAGVGADVEGPLVEADSGDLAVDVGLELHAHLDAARVGGTGRGRGRGVVPDAAGAQAGHRVGGRDGERPGRGCRHRHPRRALGGDAHRVGRSVRQRGRRHEPGRPARWVEARGSGHRGATGVSEAHRDRAGVDRGRECRRRLDRGGDAGRAGQRRLGRHRRRGRVVAREQHVHPVVGVAVVEGLGREAVAHGENAVRHRVRSGRSRQRRGVVAVAGEEESVVGIMPDRREVGGDIGLAGRNRDGGRQDEGLPARGGLVGEGARGQGNTRSGPEGAGVGAGVAAALEESDRGDVAVRGGDELDAELDGRRVRDGCRDWRLHPEQ